MTYSLDFHEKALDEWRRLDASVREHLKQKLRKRLEAPRVEADRLRGAKDRYKIKMKKPGIRLIYEVHDDRLVVAVIAVGGRERSAAYTAAAGRKFP